MRRRLRPGELPRRYLRRHDSDRIAELRAVDESYHDVDDHWDPWNQATDLDFELEQLWCAADWSAIFSLQRAGERVVTIEIDPRTCRVVQARGAFNRVCRSDEQATIARWLTALAARARVDTGARTT